MSTIESIDLHVRTYRSALKSNLEITVNSLTNSHLKMDSILHPYANDSTKVDVSALVYTLARLPSVVDKTKKVLMGQNPEVFAENGFPNITSWKKVSSAGRRRTRYFQPSTGIAASLISSISDVDDIVNLLIAYQTEWNKFHLLIKTAYPTYAKFKLALKTLDFLKVINLEPAEWDTLKTAFGPKWRLRLRRIYHRPLNIRLRLLAGSWVDYTKTVQKWWENVTLNTQKNFDITAHPLYFVSSNTHSLLNLFTGFPLLIKKNLLSLCRSEHPDLYRVYQQIQSKDIFLHEADFLNFIFRFYLHHPRFEEHFLKLQQHLKLISVPNAHYLDVNTQIFPVSSLLHADHDPRLKINRPQKIKNSLSYILNIDYPLGFSAYHILSEVLENVNQIKGVYALGKAAVLNSEIGDIEIPRLVFDEHSQNSFMFNNCFNTFFPFPNNQGSILTNQKAVSVLGTFLENDALLQKYMENNITCIEMESGPYLSAVCEATYDQQLPRGTIIDLNSAPFDVGVINYTSDTPFSQIRNLGETFLGLKGVEPVYLGSLSILQRIINLEEKL